MKELPSDLDWELVKQFKIIVEAGTFENAIKLHSFSRPTITRIFEALEKTVNKRLFERYHRNEIKLTEFGHVLFNTAKQIDEKFLSITTKPDDDNKKTPFHIATSHGIASIYLAKLMSQLREKLPGYFFHIKTNFIDPYEAINNNNILIYSKMVCPAHAIAKKIMTVNYGLFASKKYLDKSPVINKPEDLENHSIIGYSGQQDIYFGETDSFLYKIAKTDKKIYDFFSISTNSAIGEWMLAKHHHGIACLSMDKEFIEENNLVQILPELFFSDDLYLYYKKDLDQLPIDQIYDTIREK